MSYLDEKGKSKSGYQVKTRKIFDLNCVKMSKLTFRGVIKRRKIDEFRSEVFAGYHRYCAGIDCGRWFNGCAALIHAEGEASPSTSSPDCYPSGKNLLPKC
ncbi:hypothetical protein ENTCAN_05858 [Enterobacter cancerogenus ATCC 35316]|nr:hypothetical protein ENTCAN_05858 [Enterobacter cancerogenus ATCC 35316]